ncbi:MAG: GlsB/YeaQ/YmgE family stress response membrane protein [Calditrichae bacterium]|nr:GlsB/YeaQ/YmgE family stress response membrane protein [Calditrichota bacterium]MCB9057911.1 GlsB/YeaQ/YmgE family stress response membrane protein [Calditrichia bacterium]
MDLTRIVYFLVIGLVAGWSAGKMVKGRSFGMIGNIIVGIIGAIIGGYLFDVLNVHVAGFTGSLIMAVAGAVVFVFILRFINT